MDLFRASWCRLRQHGGAGQERKHSGAPAFGHTNGRYPGGAHEARRLKNVEGLADAHQLFARYLKDALAPKQPGWQVKVADEQGALADRDIIISTELLEIDGGSAALRFWIGLDTGATQSRVRVSILDKTGRDLLTTEISERTICPVGACTESNEAIADRNLQSLAGDVAEFILDPAGYQKKREAGS